MANIGNTPVVLGSKADFEAYVTALENARDGFKTIYGFSDAQVENW